MTVFQSAEYDGLLGFPLPRLRGSFVTSNLYFMSPKRLQRPRSGIAGVRPISARMPPGPIDRARARRAWARRLSAVADDATSIYWNPAGMATGAVSQLCAGLRPESRGTAQSGRDAGRLARGPAQFIAFTLPPFGLGYYRRSMAAATDLTPEGMAGPSREDGRQSVQALTTSNIGVTLAQSINDYIVVAGTVKFVRGEVTSGVSTAGDPFDALDERDSFPHRSTSRVDVDAGAMVAVEQWRLGLVGPEPDDAGVRSSRRGRRLAWNWNGRSASARPGGAAGRGSRGWWCPPTSTSRAQASMTGERRDVAAGVETWWLGQRLGRPRRPARQHQRGARGRWSRAASRRRSSRACSWRRTWPMGTRTSARGVSGARLTF